MEYIVTGTEMKAIDMYAIETLGIPSVVLMERAALSLVESISRQEKRTASIGIVVGIGNNGADGLAAARILKDYGFEKIQIYVVGKIEKATKEWQMQSTIVRNIDIPMVFYGKDEFNCEKDFSSCDIIIDGLFGIGLTREVTGIYREVIDRINETSAKVYAIDIPSGIHAEKGKIMGCAVKADITVTFGFAKSGCMLYPGAEYSGKVEVYPIGFPEKAAQIVHPSFITYGMEDLEKLPKRPVRSNKGTFGKVLLVAGCPGMSGASYLAASATYACGAGLVQVLTAEENRIVIQTQLPEAIVKTWKVGEELSYYEKIAKECCKWADVIAIGPGCGTSKEITWLMEAILKETNLKKIIMPVIIDADGLNLLARYPQWKQYNKKNWILTPHPGEMGRLLLKSVKDITEDFLLSAREVANVYSAVAVCKDARTIVDSGRNTIYINKSGNHAMAKGGSGDVLTGIIAGLLACGMGTLKETRDEIKLDDNSTLFDMTLYIEKSARLGVFIHGLAGDVVRQKKGAYSLVASDLVKALSEIFCNVEEMR